MSSWNTPASLGKATLNVLPLIPWVMQQKMGSFKFIAILPKASVVTKATPRL
jgi:hypothetical protein